MKIIIIGAGPGGYETAVAAAKKGIEVVLIESAEVGGTCLNSGCIPTKTFCKNAQVLEDVKNSSIFGVDIPSYGFDFSKVAARKNEVVSQLRTGVQTLLKHKLITLVQGKASFKDNQTIVVDGVEYSADHIIIATGSVSASLPVPGADLPGVITSTELLDLDQMPQSLCIIGAGVIGLEFASIFNTFGCKVTVVEYCKEILPRFDTDIAKRLKQSLSKKGIEIITQAQVTEIKSVYNGLKVNYLRKDKQEYVESEKVLMAVGRRPNVASLNLADAGVEFTPKGIAVNGYMQTNIPNIYAIGDINGQMMLAHAATAHGMKALRHILGEDDNIDLSVMPAAVFTHPEVGVVGLTEEDCEAKGYSIKCYKSFFRANGKAVTMNETDGYCKLISAAMPKDGILPEGHPQPGLILGCHLYGPHASDLIQEICALMNKKATVEDLRGVIHTHPTLTEVISASVSE